MYRCILTCMRRTQAGWSWQGRGRASQCLRCPASTPYSPSPLLELSFHLSFVFLRNFLKPSLRFHLLPFRIFFIFLPIFFHLLVFKLVFFFSVMFLHFILLEPFPPPFPYFPSFPCPFPPQLTTPPPFPPRHSHHSFPPPLPPNYLPHPHLIHT